MDTYLPWSVFPLLLGASAGNLSHSTFSVGSWPLTLPTHLRAFNGQGFPTSRRSSWLKTAYSTRNGAPTIGEEWFLCPFVWTRWEMAQPVSFYSQPKQLPCVQHALNMPGHLPLSHFFFASANLFGPTDSMRPKSDDTKKHHQWLMIRKH